MIDQKNPINLQIHVRFALSVPSIMLYRMPTVMRKFCDKKVHKFQVIFVYPICSVAPWYLRIEIYLICPSNRPGGDGKELSNRS